MKDYLHIYHSGTKEMKYKDGDWNIVECDDLRQAIVSCEGMGEFSKYNFIARPTTWTTTYKDTTTIICGEQE